MSTSVLVSGDLSLVFLSLRLALYLLFCSETRLFFLLYHLFLNGLAMSSIETLRSSAHPLAVRQILLVGSEEAVPPAERGRKVVYERHMVEVVVLGARPEWNYVLERPRKVFPRGRRKRESGQ